MSFDGKALGEEIVAVVRDYIERALAPMVARLADLEAAAAAIDGKVDTLQTSKATTVPELVAAKDGEPGQDGKDGVGLAGAFIDRDGELVLTLSNGVAIKLGRVIGKDGDPGKDGLSFDDFQFDVGYDGERVFTLKWSNGGKEVVRRFGVPAMIYRGVFKEGETYHLGDIVTWGGSLWHCRAETQEKPLDNAGAWQLAAKRGRDGRSAPVGEPRALVRAAK